MDTRNEQWLFAGVIAVIALVLAGVAWYRYDRDDEPAPVAAPPATPAEPSGPAHPVEPPASATADDGSRLVPLPPLGDSDGYFSLDLTTLFGQRLDDLLTDEAVIEKLVATIDNLPRGKLAERLRPLGRVPGTFATADGPGSDRYVASPDNDQRYDLLVSMFTTTDTQDIVNLYRRYYPLFQEAYVGLGYPDGYFNDRVIEVIDHLLATPDPAAPPELVRPNVLYEYADPALEGLSSGQKVLLRMGGEHRHAVEKKLRDLRAALVQTGNGA